MERVRGKDMLVVGFLLAVLFSILIALCRSLKFGSVLVLHVFPPTSTLNLVLYYKTKLKERIYLCVTSKHKV